MGSSAERSFKVFAPSEKSKQPLLGLDLLKLGKSLLKNYNKLFLVDVTVHNPTTAYYLTEHHRPVAHPTKRKAEAAPVDPATSEMECLKGCAWRKGEEDPPANMFHLTTNHEQKH